MVEPDGNCVITRPREVGVDVCGEWRWQIPLAGSAGEKGK